jgi:MFS family permease
MAATIAKTAEPAGSPRGLVMLLGFAVFINYVDRGNIATAGPVLRGDLHLSATQFGILASAFYWVYAPAQLLTGWLAERFNVGRVISVGFAVWSVATILTGVAGGFAVLLGLRLLLGLGESVSFPCSGKLLSQYTTVEERGRANGIFTVGLAFGPAFGVFVGGMILARFGWRPLFISLGALSLLWLWPWLTGPARDITASHTAPSTPSSSFIGIVRAFWVILRRREALGSALFHFCFNYSMYFLGVWLPSYLVHDRGFTIRRMAVVGGAVYLVQGVAAYAAGWGMDRWIRAGATQNRAYKVVMVVGQLATALALIGVVMGTRRMSVACLLLAGAAVGMGSPGLYAAVQTMAGPATAGRWLGLQNGIANLAGILGPAITGVLVDRTGSYLAGFALAIAVTLVGLLSWTVIVPRIEPLRWSGDVVVPQGVMLAEA